MTTRSIDFDVVGHGRHGRPRGSATLRVLRTLIRWDARYRERARLAALDHAALHDMGIAPEDAAAEAARPVWRG